MAVLKRIRHLKNSNCKPGRRDFAIWFSYL